MPSKSFFVGSPENRIRAMIEARRAMPGEVRIPQPSEPEIGPIEYQDIGEPAPPQIQIPPEGMIMQSVRTNELFPINPYMFQRNKPPIY